MVERLCRDFTYIRLDSKLLPTSSLPGLLCNVRLEMQSGNGCWIHSLHNLLGLPLAPGNTILARVLLPLRGCRLICNDVDNYQQMGVDFTDIDTAALDYTCYRNYYVQVNQIPPTSLGSMMGMIVNASVGSRDFIRDGITDDLMLFLLNALNDPVTKAGIYKGKRMIPVDNKHNGIEIFDKKHINTIQSIITVMRLGQGNNNVNAAIIYYGERRQEGQSGHYVVLWQDLRTWWNFYDSLLQKVYSAPTGEVLTAVLIAAKVKNMLLSSEKFLHAFVFPTELNARQAASLQAYNNLQSMVRASLSFYGLDYLVTCQQEQVDATNNKYMVPAVPLPVVQPPVAAQLLMPGVGTRSRSRRTVD